MDFILNAREIRILGALIEKQISTPEYYPLTLNALVNACNQKSNRDPVVNYDSDRVQQTLDALREKQFARVIYDGRVPKFSHAFTSMLDLNRPEVAVMCELMLRGPQTPGELRSRTARIHEFKSLDEVELTLDGLMEREAQALVARLPRQVGFKECRYTHLLAEAPVLDEDTASHTLPRETKEPAAEVPQQKPTPEPQKIKELEEEVETLRRDLSELRQQFMDFRKQFE